MMSKQLKKYSTERLDLIAADLELVNAELNSINDLAKLLNAKVGNDWPPGEYDRGAQEYFKDQFIKYGEKIIGWQGWYAVKSETQNEPPILIAAAGYFGPPSESGDIEIGFSVCPLYHGNGYATEIVNALIEIAGKDRRVKRIIARTTENNRASRKVLEKTGFQYVGFVDEDKILFEKMIFYTG